MRLIKDFLNGLSALFFPPICKGCEQRMAVAQGVICADCWQKLKLFPPEVLKTKIIPESLVAVWPVYLFDDLLQKIVHALKYQGNISLGHELGERMGQNLPQEISGLRAALLVPIPLHPIKLRERGYNQSEAIARGLGHTLEIPVEIGLLKRIKNTVTQTKLNAAERQANMQTAFTIKNNRSIDPECTVILVDDVFTTGATLGSAAAAFHQVGMRRIMAVTAAAPI
ncbi:MAG: ComF family protein [Candidatus Neomarinimicrobiota bacterium]